MDRTLPTRPPAETRQPTRLAFHATRIIIDIGVLIVLVAMNLPFVQSAVGERSAVTADALPALLLLIPVFLITLLPDHTRPLPTPLGWIAFVLGASAFPYAIVKFLDASNVAETVAGSVGSGARILVLGTFVTLVGILVGLMRGLLSLPTGGAVPGPRPEPSYGSPARASSAPGSRSAGAPAAPRSAPGRQSGSRQPAAPPGHSTASPPPPQAQVRQPEQRPEQPQPQPQQPQRAVPPPQSTEGRPETRADRPQPGPAPERRDPPPERRQAPPPARPVGTGPERDQQALFDDTPEQTPPSGSTATGPAPDSHADRD